MLRGMRASRAWLACLLLLLTLGCQADGNDDLPAVTPSRSGPAGTDTSLREAALALVDQREEALRSGDRDAFLATVDPDELAFSSTQARWFDNLGQLPVTDVSYELGDESVMTQVAGAGDLQLPVDFTMRMRGFDRHPVTQRMVWTFVRDGNNRPEGYSTGSRKEHRMSLLWIILIVVLVLALLGFFGRGRF